jgi:hypothetical protein
VNYLDKVRTGNILVLIFGCVIAYLAVVALDLRSEILTGILGFFGGWFVSDAARNKVSTTTITK